MKLMFWDGLVKYLKTIVKVMVLLRSVYKYETKFLIGFKSVRSRRLVQFATDYKCSHLERSGFVVNGWKKTICYDSETVRRRKASSSVAGNLSRARWFYGKTLLPLLDVISTAQNVYEIFFSFGKYTRNTL